ncbi:UbiH/UbiF family hydroxylase [Albirhodobacter sp. R86504]|uniref:UbiH/UbiF family hydroxylase n=1 Tax=Albirhodobacter sp. R86504 TaxID=3093848 RepID=UPI00366DE4DE
MSQTAQQFSSASVPARETVDVLISGGGVAGLTAAAAFASAGFSVMCVDPEAPATTESDPRADLRSTAFLQASLPVLAQAGLWARLKPYATPLQVMRIVDAGGESMEEARLTREFDAADLSDEPFGWNLPNWLLRREMVARLNELPNVDFRTGVRTAKLFTREVEARVTLDDGAQITARLVIAADGRKSPMREAAGIAVTHTDYAQKALAFAVTHDMPHNNISTEIHRSGGPFTFVPLPDRDGRHASAIVWMERNAEADRLAALPVDEFEVEMQARSTGIMGKLKLETRRSVWPMETQLAERFNGQRLALMAEAAHCIPPIGAQGLNMSLADLGCLLDLAKARPENLGDAQMLEAYHRKRWYDVRLRELGIDLLNRASMVEARPLRDLRAGVLGAMYGIKSVRKTLMRAGIGVR